MHAFITKMNFTSCLSREEETSLQACVEGHQAFSKGRTFLNQGKKTDGIHVLTEGWACRYKIAVDGSEQIISFMLPGDSCEDIFPIANTLDHSVKALGPVRVAMVNRQQIMTLTDHSPALSSALAWSCVVDKSIMGEWLLNVTRRSAVVRLAHLLCELYVRASIIGRVERHTMYFPLTQIVMSEALGLSAVHLNRSIQSLRQQGLVSLEGRKLTIRHWSRLTEFAEFNDDYLHLDRKLVTDVRMAS